MKFNGQAFSKWKHFSCSVWTRQVWRKWIVYRWIHCNLNLRKNLSKLSAWIFLEPLCMHAQSCPTLCDPMDCSAPGSSVCGFSRKEYWNGLPFPTPGDSSWPKYQTPISCIGRQILYPLCHLGSPVRAYLNTFLKYPLYLRNCVVFSK